MIFYGKQSISEEDIAAVSEVLRDSLITQGPVSQRLERAICDYTGAKFALACSHGSAALHLACLACEIGVGDLVWTVPNTFVASANCALYCQADVDFVDINPDTFNICTQSLERKLVKAEKTGRLPKALIVVHFAGLPCDMVAISKLSKRYGFRVIEDACHALGAKYHGQKVGACEFSDITTFSLHPVKSITAGEGGLLLTNDREIAARARLFANHGITRDPGQLDFKDAGPWHYEQHVLGFNYRITDFQCALALCQLQRLDDFIAQRTSIAQSYLEAFSPLGFRTQSTRSDTRSAWHLFVIRSELDHFDKVAMFEAFREKGIMLNCHYIPVHLQPYYRRRYGFTEEDFPNAEAYFNQSVSLPIYPDLSELEQQHVIHTVKALFK